ncbi:hypothetical protein MASR2M15_01900 [Anaerolineales bacterium]
MDFADFDPNGENVTRVDDIDQQLPILHTSIARCIALEVLYEVDSVPHPLGEVLNRQIQSHADVERVSDMVRTLVLGVKAHQTRLDKVLQEYATEWPFHQVATIDRNILRLALFEICINQKVPLAVAIDEAVNLANLYGADGATRFVNGVLGSVGNNVEKIASQLRSENP